MPFEGHREHSAKGILTGNCRLTFSGFGGVCPGARQLSQRLSLTTFWRPGLARACKKSQFRVFLQMPFEGHREQSVKGILTRNCRLAFSGFGGLCPGARQLSLRLRKHLHRCHTTDRGLRAKRLHNLLQGRRRANFISVF